MVSSAVNLGSNVEQDSRFFKNRSVRVSDKATGCDVDSLCELTGSGVLMWSWHSQSPPALVWR